jgi:hypothetical protein
LLKAGQKKYVNLFHIMAGVYKVRGLVVRAADRFLNDNRWLAWSNETGMLFAHTYDNMSI